MSSTLFSSEYHLYFSQVQIPALRQTRSPAKQIFVLWWLPLENPFRDIVDIFHNEFDGFSFCTKAWKAQCSRAWLRELTQARIPKYIINKPIDPLAPTIIGLFFRISNLLNWSLIEGILWSFLFYLFEGKRSECRTPRPTRSGAVFTISFVNMIRSLRPRNFELLPSDQGPKYKLYSINTAYGVYVFPSIDNSLDLSQTLPGISGSKDNRFHPRISAWHGLCFYWSFYRKPDHNRTYFISFVFQKSTCCFHLGNKSLSVSYVSQNNLPSSCLFLGT